MLEHLHVGVMKSGPYDLDDTIHGKLYLYFVCKMSY